MPYADAGPPPHQPRLSTAFASSSPPRRPPSSPLPFPYGHYPETDAAPVIDHVDDDPSLLEPPDDGSQEPDDATDDYYYPEDAYYYVKTADD